ncbi:MAG: shikimate kinase [Lysobacterales bacterium]
MLASRSMHSADNLVLVGPMGAGKSTLAACLGALSSRPVRDLDREIEAASGDTITAIFERFGEAHFRAQENALLEAVLAAEGQIVACGGGVVLAARNRELMVARAFVVWLDAPPDLLARRMKDDRSRPLLRGPSPGARLAELAAQRDPLYAEAADLRFAVDDAPVVEQAARLMQDLPTRWSRVLRDE